jgi:hypothetical protein
MLQCCLEIGERRNVRFAVLVDPPVVNEADRHRVEKVQLLAARSPCEDEPGVLEDAQVFHHAEARQLQHGLELGERAAVTREEPVEQVAPRRVRQRPEHAVVVHAPTIRDLLVTCQAGPVAPPRARPFCISDRKVDDGR